MPREGFNNQWVEICKIGEFVEAGGTTVKVDENFLNTAIANFNAADHEPPLCVGHPSADAPAYGWIQKMRLAEDRLVARFSDTNDDLEKLVEKGAYKKRSTAFYTHPVRVKHVGLLGAAPPAVKGLKNIQFAEGETVAFESSFNLQETKMKEQDLDQMPESFWEKVKSKLGLDKAPEAGQKTAEFSETDVKSLVAEALKTAKEEITTEFTEKLKAKDDEIKEIRESVQGQAASGKRAEIAQFVEAIPAENGKHFLKRIGVVNFLEACANADAANKNAEFVAFSEGEGDAKKDHKFTLLGFAKNLVEAMPPMIEFGEKFGKITATAEANTPVDTSRVAAMKDEMGLKEKENEGGKS